MLKRINRALPELVAGIIIYGLVVQAAGVWFIADKLRYSTGLWIGIFTAVGMAIHIAVILEDAVSQMAANKVRSKVIIHSMLRYILVVVIFFLVAYLNLGNIITLFVGAMGLKVGAYLQPFTHKAIQKLTGKGEESLDSENNK